MKKAKFNYSPNLVKIVAFIMLLVVLIYQRFDGQQNTLDVLKKVLPDTISYESSEGKYPAYRAFNENKVLIGYGVITNASGYGGPITILSGIDPKGSLVKIEITENHETPLYLNKVIEHGFLDKFTGKSTTDPVKLGEDLDAISGATVSSEGITSAVRKAVNQVGVHELGFP